MSGYRCVNYYDLCRLCTSSTGGTKINIFSNEGKKKNLMQKITESLPVAIDENDKLPKVLCGECLQQIESISDYRTVCLNSQAMLLGCLNSTTLQNGGKVYIKDANPKITFSTISNIPINNQIQNNQNSDLLSSIIQAVGLQNDEMQELKTTMIPQYTVTMDTKTIKNENYAYKIPEIPSNVLQQQQQQQIEISAEKQAKHNSLAEFLKMKPNIRVTPIKKKEIVTTSPQQIHIQQQQSQQQQQHQQQQQQQQQQQTITIKTEQLAKPKKPKYNIVLTSPNKQGQAQIIQQQISQPQLQQIQQQQQATIISSSTLQQAQQQVTNKTVTVPDWKFVTPNSKCFLPITIKDGNNDQQIVAQIDTKNLVLPTTYHLKLQPQITTVDGQQIVQLTPTAIPATISLASSQTISTQQYQQQQDPNNQILSASGVGSIDVSTSTNDQEIILTTNQLQNPQNNGITFQQLPQTTTIQQQTSLPQLQIKTIPVTTIASNPNQQQNQQITMQKQSNNSITVQRINTNSGVVINQQQSQGTMKIRTTKLTAAQAKQVVAAQVNASKKAAALQQQKNLQKQVQPVQQLQQQPQQQQQVQQPQQQQQITLVTNKIVRKKTTKKESTAQTTAPVATTNTISITTQSPNATTQDTTATNTSSNLLACSLCSKAFKKKEHLHQHMKLHAGLRPFKCTEAGCSKAFSRKEHLMRHIVSHTGKKMFNCDLCQKFFSRKDNLNKHKRTHSDQGSGTNGQFVCDVCNKTFVVKMYYNQHKQLHEKNGQTTGSGTVKIKQNAETEDNTIEEISSQVKLEQDQQQIEQIVQLQLPVVTSSDLGNNTITISQADGTTTTHSVLKSLGSHDTTVLNLPQGFANYVQLNSGQFVNTATGEIMNHIKLEK